MRRPDVRIGNRFFAALVVAAFSLASVSPSLAVLRHEYLFNSGNGTEIIDSVGTAHGTVVGTTIIPADGRLTLGGGEQYGNLPASTIAINTFSELTLEMWLTVDPSNNNIFTAAAAFGTTLPDGFGSNYFMLQPTRATNQSSAQITAVSGGTEAFVGGPQLASGGLRHIAATVDSTQIAYYIDGALQGTTLLSTPATPASLASLSNDFAYIGNSVWAFDPTLVGSIFEMRIYDDAKDAAEVSTLFANGCVDGCGGDLYLEVDRDTGAARVINDLSNRNLVIYSITSAIPQTAES